MRADVGIARGGQHRDAGAARTAGDNRRPKVELADKSAQRVGLVLRFAFAQKAGVRIAAIGPVVDQHAPAGLGELFRHFLQSRHIHRETPARRQRDRGVAFLADQLIGDADAVYVHSFHDKSLSVFALCDCLPILERRSARSKS